MPTSPEHAATGGRASAPGRPRVFISAAEPSGDRHAASLIREMRRICPELTFLGLAGPAMQAAGCQAIEDLTGRAVMLLGALQLAGHAHRLLGRIHRMLVAHPADLVILVDSPALHLPLAKRAKSAGCPVLYYIAPQLWAWAPWRIGRLRRRVDRLAVILPFEEAYFRQRGVEARYVGHPLIEQLQAQPPRPDAVRQFRQQGQLVIACLPGSRQHVVREVLPGQIEVARAIAARHPHALFLFAAASAALANGIRDALAGESLASRVELGHNAEILAAADLALCASGTATLEVAYHRVPMIVMYNGSKWGYRLIGRWLIRTPHLSLVNILAGRPIVPEFMPYYTSTAPIVAEALDLLANPSRRATMQSDLSTIITSLGPASAARQTALLALDLLGATTRRCVPLSKVVNWSRRV